MKNLIFITFLVFTNFLYSQKDKITVSGLPILEYGNWTKILSASDINGAGNDYNSSIFSALNQSLITVSPGGASKNYVNINVLVHREDFNWNSDLTLNVRRTDKGNNGNNIISGGINFQAILNTGYTVVFSCTGQHTDVPLQYEITGISVLLPVPDPLNPYSTKIVYTLMN